MRTISKQPSERDVLTLTFEGAQRKGETLSNATVVVVRLPGGEVVTDEMIDGPAVPDGASVSCWYQGGEHGKDYKLTVEADGSSGAHYEADVRIRVRDE